jgi:hypothetical protein
MTNDELELLKAILEELRRIRKSIDEVNDSIITLS